ncbi:MAG: signal recognition particle protein [Planctomycetota bacterium]
MFDRLSEGFGNALKKLSGQGTISEANVREAMAEVETALLDADVSYEVVKSFCKSVLEDAQGTEVTKSLKPGQEMIGIVHRRLVELLGGDPNAEPGQQAPPPDILRVSPGPTVVMMCGLQGSGKTTTCGKLAGWLKKRGRSVMLVAADLQRPAAVDQLETIANQVRDELPGSAEVSFYAERDKTAAYGEAVGVAVEVCNRALSEARRQNIDTVILDTAGRLHVNDELMGELHAVARGTTPHQIFLVIDAMTGQDAVNSAKSFHERLEVDGVILSKFDSDTRGGAALSVREVTGAPIRFIGVGEHLDRLEGFHAERVAGRILGMGDVVSLVEKAQEQVSEEEAEKLQNKMAKGELGMDDFLKQLRMLRKMGPMKQLLGMLPGVGQMLKDVDIDDGQLDRVEAMIQSMTPDERRKPSVINISRRKRIGVGSGTSANEVGQLSKQFETVSKMTKAMSGMGGKGKADAVRQLSREGGMGAMIPGLEGNPMLRAKSSTKSSGGGRFKSRKGKGGGGGKRKKR